MYIENDSSTKVELNEGIWANFLPFKYIFLKD